MGALVPDKRSRSLRAAWMLTFRTNSSLTACASVTSSARWTKMRCPSGVDVVVGCTEDFIQAPCSASNNTVSLEQPELEASSKGHPGKEWSNPWMALG